MASIKKISERTTGIMKFRFTMMTATESAFSFIDKSNVYAATNMQTPAGIAVSNSSKLIILLLLDTSEKTAKKRERQSNHTEGVTAISYERRQSSDSFL